MKIYKFIMFTYHTSICRKYKKHHLPQFHHSIKQYKIKSYMKLTSILRNTKILKGQVKNNEANVLQNGPKIIYL